MNLAAVPVSVVPGFTSVGEIDSVGATTTTVPLLTRSAPRQLLANAGITEYPHVPSGTPFSMQGSRCHRAGACATHPA